MGIVGCARYNSEVCRYIANISNGAIIRASKVASACCTRPSDVTGG